PASGVNGPSRLKLGLKSYIVCSETSVSHGMSTGVDDGVAAGSLGSAPGVGVSLPDAVGLRVGSGSGVVHAVRSRDAASRADADVTARAGRRSMCPLSPGTRPQ